MHGSVSYGPRRYTHELLTGRTKIHTRSFNETKWFLLSKCQPTSLSHIPKSCQAFSRYKPSKISSVCFFFFFLQRCGSCHKTQKHYSIALKFGILKGWIRAHPDTKCGCININGHKDINDYLRKVTLICYPACRVNR